MGEGNMDLRRREGTILKIKRGSMRKMQEDKPGDTISVPREFYKVK
jgi:hypothetical protein